MTKVVELLKKVSVNQLVKLYTDNGISKKTVDALKTEIASTPLKGVIAGLDKSPREFRGNKYFVFIIQDENGKNIGELSVNRLFDSYLTEGEVLQVNNAESENNSKWMLASRQLNNMSQYGKSRAEQIVNVIGKSYTAEKVTKKVLTLYTKEVMFVSDEVYQLNPEQAKGKLWKNTSAKDLLQITFE